MSFGKFMLPAKAWAVVLLVSGILGLQLQANAQTDNLMIVKYVDWSSGSGVAVVIWNPTPAPVNLANYQLRIFGNGSATPTTTSNLSGILQPCGTILVGNDEYRNTNCRNSVSGNNFDAFSPGVNGNDVVALTYTAAVSPVTTAPFQVIDAIGRIGYDPGNNNSQKVNNVSDALFQNRIERLPGNMARYSLSSGTYNPAITNAANIWPNNRTTNVLGWTVSGSSCLSNSWNQGTTVMADAGPDLNFACKSLVAISLSGTTVTPGALVQWSGGKGTFSNPTALKPSYTPSPLDPSRIVLTMVATLGCRQVSDQLIIQNGDSTEQPKAMTYTPANPMVGDTVTFVVQIQNPGKLILTTFNYGDGSPAETKRMLAKHVFTKAGSYDVRVGSINMLGCPLDSIMQKVVVTEKPVVINPVPEGILIPNIFTPNNDGFNDTFKPQLPATTLYNLQVFNRWGSLLFESDSPEKVWDGKNVSDGVYFVHLKVIFTNGQFLDRKLPVTVVR